MTEKQIVQEESIIEAAKKESNKFKPLYEKYYVVIFRFVYNKVEEKETAADITSHVFLKALLNLHKYQHKNLPFSSWLYRIAHNEVMQYYRKAKKEKVVYISEDLVLNLTEDPETLDPELLKIKLESALAALEYKEIEMIQLRFYEGLPFKDIGQILNISENNAKVKIYRLLDKIKKKLSQSVESI